MLFSKKPFPKKYGYYSIPMVDLSVEPENTPEELKYLYNYSIVDDHAGYLGHPDSVLLNNGDILTFYPKGHGKGAVISKISDNDGVSYDKTIGSRTVANGYKVAKGAAVAIDALHERFCAVVEV